jgi:sec-independent protein translocase protein TatC
VAGKKQKDKADVVKKKPAPKRPADQKPKKAARKPKAPAAAPSTEGGETFAQRLFRELQEEDRTRAEYSAMSDSSVDPAGSAIPANSTVPRVSANQDNSAETQQEPVPKMSAGNGGGSNDTGTSWDGGDSGDDGGILKDGFPLAAISSFIDRLRGGILATLVLLIITTIAGFFFSDHILGVINLPFIESGQKLNIFTVTGGFMIRLKASFGAAVLAVFPFFVQRIWRVASPSIPKESKMFSRLSVIASILLFYSGIAFVYFLLMPAAVKILLNFIGGSMASTIGADDYLSFTIMFSLAMGVLFDTPIIVMILTYLGIITPQTLLKYWKHAIVVIWIIAALITPTPDPLTQSLVAVPLMLFFGISILASQMVVRRKHKALAREEQLQD